MDGLNESAVCKELLCLFCRKDDDLQIFGGIQGLLLYLFATGNQVAVGKVTEA